MFNKFFVCRISILKIASFIEVLDFVGTFTNLDSTITKTIFTFSVESGKQEEEVFRIGDYFDEIKLKIESDSAFSIIFKLKECDSSWKDIVVGILKDIRKIEPEIKTSMRMLNE